MTTTMLFQAYRPAAAAAALLAAATLVAAGCGGSGDETTAITIDGSSTVAPLSEAAAERYMAEHDDVRITVGTSGTGGGFEKFCRGEVDIADASRAIKDDEAAACDENGIEYTQLTVANDGIAIVTGQGNDAVDCITSEQLREIWAPDSTVDRWSDVDPAWPDTELALFGPGTDSGTFDFFTDAVVGEEGSSRTDYNATEDDNVIVRGVAGSEGGLGYLGLSYAEENADELRIIPVDDGDGCVEPSAQTVQSGEYSPLSRPLFVYPSATLLGTDAGLDFIRFYIERSDELAEQALYVPLTREQREAALEQVDELAGGGAAGEGDEAAGEDADA